MKILSCWLVALFVVSVSGVAFADGGFGRDIWTGYIDQKGLWTPHPDDCVAAETFIASGPGSLGFCMEDSEHAAQPYEIARKTCTDLGKRLPEPNEFKFACNAAPSGLNDMTDDWEWSSNYVRQELNASYGGHWASLMGSGGCKENAMGRWGTTSEETYVFRCVR
jgi:hypothetical protein